MQHQKHQSLVLNQTASNKRLNNSHNQDLVNQLQGKLQVKDSNKHLIQVNLNQVKPIMYNLLNQTLLVKRWKDSGHGSFLLWLAQQ